MFALATSCSCDDGILFASNLKKTIFNSEKYKDINGIGKTNAL
jgi:hypothetical protein